MRAEGCISDHRRRTCRTSSIDARIAATSRIDPWRRQTLSAIITWMTKRSSSSITRSCGRFMVDKNEICEQRKFGLEGLKKFGRIDCGPNLRVQKAREGRQVQISHTKSVLSGFKSPGEVRIDAYFGNGDREDEVLCFIPTMLPPPSNCFPIISVLACMEEESNMWCLTESFVNIPPIFIQWRWISDTMAANSSDATIVTVELIFGSSTFTDWRTTEYGWLDLFISSGSSRWWEWWALRYDKLSKTTLNNLTHRTVNCCRQTDLAILIFVPDLLLLTVKLRMKQLLSVSSRADNESLNVTSVHCRYWDQMCSIEAPAFDRG